MSLYPLVCAGRYAAVTLAVSVLVGFSGDTCAAEQALPVGSPPVGWRITSGVPLTPKTTVAQPSGSNSWRPRLLTTVYAAVAAPLARDARRQRPVGINLDLLGGRYGVRPAATTFDVDLFDGVVRTAVLDRLESSTAGRTWVGHLDGVPGSFVLFAVVNGAVQGSVSAIGLGTFEIRHDAEGLATLVQLNLTALGDDVIVPPADLVRGVAPAIGPATVVTDDPNTIDVLLVYTQAAAALAKGVDALLANVDKLFVYMNEAFARSQVSGRVRLVGVVPTSYVEAEDSMFTDVGRLANKNDGYLDDVHALRDQAGADLVSLLTDVLKQRTVSGSGVAYVACNNGRCDENLGFSVLGWDLYGRLMAHELGHNLGGTHDWYKTESGGFTAASKGHDDPDGGFMSTMSYADRLIARGAPCADYPGYSNPAVSFNGRPTGVAANTNRSCKAGNVNNPPCDADMAATLLITVPLVSRFRAAAFNEVGFPPRDQTFDFRQQLEAKYRDGLRRSAVTSYVDVEGSLVWTAEYLRYRAQQCTDAIAQGKIRGQIAGQGVPLVCGSAPTGAVPFPARNESYAFRQVLETLYRDQLRRPPSSTFVDPEGEVVWVQEYLRYRLNKCDHAQATDRVLRQIDGGGIQPTCG